MSPAPELPSAARPILLFLDLCGDFLPCLRQACEMAARLGQPLMVLHVIRETAAGTQDPASAHPDPTACSPVESAHARLAEQVRHVRATSSVLDRLRGLWLVVLEDIPENGILECAAHYGAGWILLCPQSRICGWLQDSLAERVMRRAPCPVLVVHQEESQMSPQPSLPCRDGQALEETDPALWPGRRLPAIAGSGGGWPPEAGVHPNSGG